MRYAVEALLRRTAAEERRVILKPMSFCARHDVVYFSPPLSDAQHYARTTRLLIFMSRDAAYRLSRYATTFSRYRACCGAASKYILLLKRHFLLIARPPAHDTTLMPMAMPARRKRPGAATPRHFFCRARSHFAPRLCRQHEVRRTRQRRCFARCAAEAPQRDCLRTEAICHSRGRICAVVAGSDAQCRPQQHAVPPAQRDVAVHHAMQVPAAEHTSRRHPAKEVTLCRVSR